MPNINITRSSMPTYEEYCEEIRGLWDSRWLTNMGIKHRQLEADLKNYLHTPNITLYTNGHLALEHIISAMDFPAGSEIITTPFTFASTTQAIVRCGCVPVFCDVEKTYYTLDASKLEACITDQTVAILPVHVYGNLCDVDAIQAIADKHYLKVIYDAAHAFGVTRGGVSSANFGDASMFSFHATKVFHTIEGGAVAYSDGNLVDKLNALKNFGMTSAEDVPYVGGNAKMNEFQAAMGVCNLRHLDSEIAKRKIVVEHYRQRLSDVAGLHLCPAQEDVQSNYAYFPVVFETVSRDQIFAHLQENHITARKYFYPLTSDFACYGDIHTAVTPVAQSIAQNVLCLPLYADLALEDVDRICDLILNLL